MIEPRWEVKVGSTVMTKDGEYGHLQQLLMDPHKEQVVALLVRPHRLIPSHTIVVPEKFIADASDKEVWLKISQDLVEALPQYRSDSKLIVEGESYETDDKLFAVRGKQGIEVGRAPSPKEPGMIEDRLTDSGLERFGLRLRADQQVSCLDGYAGRVSLILLDPSGQIKGFVLHTGRFHLIGRRLIVPAAWVQEIDRKNVHLSVERDDLKSLPEYYPDNELGAVVDHALWSDDILRNTDYQELGIVVNDGIVRLRGHVGTARNKRVAEETARSIPGVLNVENNLVVDSDLVFEVAQALGKNQLTRSERISVGAQNGFIKLNGYVTRADIRDAAEAIVASISQVRGVLNELQAPNVIIKPEKHQFLQPRIGQRVAATDMHLGQVEKVIINPCNRRVTAFVTRGCFPDLRKKDNYRLPDEGTQLESSVVIPIDAVRHVTDSYVLLGVRGVEAALNRSFGSADFMSPAADWQPPYPYRWDQVLFDGQRLKEPKFENCTM